MKGKKTQHSEAGQMPGLCWPIVLFIIVPEQLGQIFFMGDGWCRLIQRNNTACQTVNIQ